MRELIATRFHLAAYVARDQDQPSGAATATASAAATACAGTGTTTPWYPLLQATPGAALLSPLVLAQGKRPDAGLLSAEGLMQAVRSLDVGASTAVLSPACILAPSAGSPSAAEPADPTEPASAEQAGRGLDHLLG